MSFERDARRWAEQLFGGCHLGDRRRTDRLVDYAARQATDPEGSTSRACRADAAAREAAYRLLRNDDVLPRDIDEGAFAAVAESSVGLATVLAIQDSTGISFTHPMAEVLRQSGNPTGFMVHATLLVDASNGMPLGLADQERWIRDEDGPGRDSYNYRHYRKKESFKWEAACERLRQRMPTMKPVVTVCDREADIYEFLLYQLKHELRFVVRACANRYLKTPNGRLWEIMEAQPIIGTREVDIGQRGGQGQHGRQTARRARRARTAVVTIRAARVELAAPCERVVDERRSLPVTAVLVRNSRPPKGEKPLEWLLLTTETVESVADAIRIVEYYEKRWLIEEYIKAWKSGCRVEKRPLQSIDNLERMMVITAHVAVRLMQLRALSVAGRGCDSCESAFTREEWHCLHKSVAPEDPLPARAPPVRWALESIARLGGWANSKGTGQIGWSTLWHGWDVYQQQLAGWRMALSARETM